jgi:hypothetical protein
VGIGQGVGAGCGVGFGWGVGGRNGVGLGKGVGTGHGVGTGQGVGGGNGIGLGCGVGGGYAVGTGCGVCMCLVFSIQGINNNKNKKLPNILTWTKKKRTKNQLTCCGQGVGGE